MHDNQSDTENYNDNVEYDNTDTNDDNTSDIQHTVYKSTYIKPLSSVPITPGSRKGKLGMIRRISSSTAVHHTPYKPHTTPQQHKLRTQHTPMTLAEKLKQRSLAARQCMSQRSRGDVNADAVTFNKQLNLRREPLLPELSVSGAENISDTLKFHRCRIEGQPKDSALALLRDRKIGRRLGALGRLSGVIPSYIDVSNQFATTTSIPTGIDVVHDTSYEPLYLYQPSADELTTDPALQPIIVDEFIGRKLRPHQREGVQFMAECVLSLRAFDGSGCILADDMGLGKTCQSVTLLYTLLRHGRYIDTPICRRVIVVCPTSLVSNWKNEVYKWVGDQLYVIALTDSDKKAVDRGIDDFLRPYPGQKKAHVLVLSYDTYRRRKSKFNKPDTCDLLICDEAHRLKNADTAIYRALDGLPCKRRILLSGTPLQNDLSEFYAMVNFVNNNVLGDQHIFARYYEHPILMGREPDAYDDERQLGASRSVELSAIVNQFVLRRTNVLLSQHLPPKVMQVVCCRPTPLQISLYQYFSESKAAKQLANTDNGNNGTAVLPLIDKFKKLCNHPKIIYDNEIKNDPKVATLFPSTFLQNPVSPEWSGKMHVLDVLLSELKQRTDDRVVIVSNFTNTLDVIADICKLRKWSFLRLDGSTAVKKRQDLVDQLSDRFNNIFVFLLSSKAGGCGLNMIGANRLILFDPDWNPAVDKQAAARIWRDGQTKRCYIYRFVTTGSIEEKIYQRQITKEGLQGAIGGESIDSNVSMAELKDLFQLQSETAVPLSDTHDTLECCCCQKLVGNANKRERKFRVRKQKHKSNQCHNENSAQKNSVSSGSDDDAIQSTLHNNELHVDSTSSNDECTTPPITPQQSIQTISPSKITLSRHVNAKQFKSPSTIDLDDAGRHPRASWQSTAMLGQRGEPAEDELINWGHHATVLSVPDAILRTTYNRLKMSHTDWPIHELDKLYISFVFSCEVRGKSLSVDDDMSAAAISSISDLPPVNKKKAEAEVVTMTATEAQQRHNEWLNRKSKKHTNNTTSNNGNPAHSIDPSTIVLSDDSTMMEDDCTIVQHNNNVLSNTKQSPIETIDANTSVVDDEAPVLHAVKKAKKESTKSSKPINPPSTKPNKGVRAFRPSIQQLAQYGIEHTVWSTMSDADKEPIIQLLVADLNEIAASKSPNKQTNKKHKRK